LAGYFNIFRTMLPKGAENLRTDQLARSAIKANQYAATFRCPGRGYLLRQAGIKGGEGECSSVTLMQRFGSAANLNIHLHCLVLDGVYRTNATGDGEDTLACGP
jgi:Putative transposase